MVAGTHNIDLGEAPKLNKSGNKFRILALSGGGYRGLFTALVLADLEKEAGKSLNKVFDLIAGTSIGGIIATGLAAGVPAEDIANGLKEHGPKIFPSGILKGVKHLFKHKYDSAPLIKAIEDILPEHHNQKIKEISPGLLITAVSQTLAAPRIFGSNGLVQSNEDMTVMEVLLSTSAAPTYFPPMIKDGHSYIDGGLIANAPDLVALTQTLSGTSKSIQDCWMLSVGTVSSDISKAAVESSNGMGILKWMTTEHLFDVTLTAQEKLAVAQTKQLLKDRYLRIDPTPGEQQAKAIALDKANKAATDTLSILSGEAISLVRANNMTMLQKLLH